MTFEEFAACRLPAIVVFAGVLTGDRAVAEDVVQEVLIRAHRRWAKIGVLDHPERYVRKMVVNQFLSLRRGTWRDVPSGNGAEVDDRRSPDHADRHAERDALLAELRKLPAKQLAVIVLRYYEGQSDAEIAGILGCRTGTVRGYVSRALGTLRVEMTPPSQVTRSQQPLPGFAQEGIR